MLSRNYPTHSGGIVFQKNEASASYLLVRPKRAPSEWVFPKGHIEPGEEIGDAALREVREETGAVARLLGPLQTIEFRVRAKEIRVTFFLMELIAEGPAEETREILWAAYEQALTLLTHDQSRAVLRAAESKRLALGDPA